MKQIIDLRKKIYKSTKKFNDYFQDTLFWILFNVFIPGFPFFLSLFLRQFVDLEQNIKIVMEADIFILGASVASNAFENAIVKNNHWRKLHLAISFASLLFYFGIYLVLYVPELHFAFRKVTEETFWNTIYIVGFLNVIIGYYYDIIIEKGDKLNVNGDTEA